MSMSDPIADMLIRIKNAQAVNKRSVSMSASNIKAAIASVLKDEGYIQDFALEDGKVGRELRIDLKYMEGRGVIEKMERYSRPSRRTYFGKDELPTVLDGLGIAIVSTSRGVMTDARARAEGHGGEVLCLVA